MHIKFGKCCESCDLLRDLLEEERTNSRRLLDKLLALTNPIADVPESNEGIQQPIRPRSWRMRRTLLEEEDRKRAQLLRDKENEMGKIEIKMASVEELENELGVADGNVQ